MRISKWRPFMGGGWRKELAVSSFGSVAWRGNVIGFPLFIKLVGTKIISNRKILCNKKKPKN
jgi:hypothetical protein